MIGYFFDSSALAKRYIPKEIGAEWVETIVKSTPRTATLIAQITPAEIVSALQRYARENKITVRSAHAARLMLDRHVAREYVNIRLTPQIVRLAQDLLQRHTLRAYDAVQLASAIAGSSGMGSLKFTQYTFVSADNRLLSAAAAEGFVTDNPNAHP